MRKAWLWVGVVAALGACTPSEDNDDLLVRGIRENLPNANQVALNEPAGSKGTTGAQSFDTTLGEQGGNTSGFAEYYLFTRHIFDGVNVGTAWVLGTVTLIAAYPPTSVAGKTATWGPASEAENPSEWQLRVTKNSDGSYAYALEGRKKGTSGEFVAVLDGTAKGKTGHFVLDFDAANELDPARLGGETESGTTTVDYALAQLPSTITASVRPADPSYFDVTVTRETDGRGRVDITSHGDTDDAKDTQLEDVTMKSRWIATGAGRADVTVTGGDVPTPPGTFRIAECWSSGFTRSYYSDDAQLAPAEGNVSQCPYDAPEPL